jgi:hypothetical protein
MMAEIPMAMPTMNEVGMLALCAIIALLGAAMVMRRKQDDDEDEE